MSAKRLFVVKAVTEDEFSGTVTYELANLLAGDDVTVPFSKASLFDESLRPNDRVQLEIRKVGT